MAFFLNSQVDEVETSILLLRMKAIFYFETSETGRLTMRRHTAEHSNPQLQRCGKLTTLTFENLHFITQLRYVICYILFVVIFSALGK